MTDRDLHVLRRPKGVVLRDFTVLIGTGSPAALGSEWCSTWLHCLAPCGEVGLLAGLLAVRRHRGFEGRTSLKGATADSQLHPLEQASLPCSHFFDAHDAQPQSLFCPPSALQLHSALQSNNSNQALSLPLLLPLPVLAVTLAPSVVPSADTLSLPQRSPTESIESTRIDPNPTSMHPLKGKGRRC